MGILDAVKGLFESNVVQGALESTGLGDHLGAIGEQVPVSDLAGTELAGVADLAGADVGQVADLVPTDVLPGEVLPAGDIADVADGIGLPGAPAP
jgi:hypothetical protein